MRRPGSRRARGFVVLGAVLVALLIGGVVVVTRPGGPVAGAVDADSLSSADRAACRSFLASLGAVLDGQPAREVPADVLGRAWGDPTISVACGVGPGEGFTEGSPCVQVDGVDWYYPPDQARADGDVTLTLVGYEPRVLITVPGNYRPEGPATAMAELGSSVTAHLRRTTACSANP